MKMTRNLFIMVSGLAFFTLLTGPSHSSDSTAVGLDSGWNIRVPGGSRALGDRSNLIGQWANDHYGRSPVQGDPDLPLTVVKTIDFRVLQIPKGRRLAEPEEALPKVHSVTVLRDARNNLHLVESQQFRDDDTIHVVSVGPALSNDFLISAAKDSVRRLSDWPPRDLREEAERNGGVAVLVPYPLAMNQLFYQFGRDPRSARFTSIQNGLSYNGLDALLDAIESEWSQLGLGARPIQ